MGFNGFQKRFKVFMHRGFERGLTGFNLVLKGVQGVLQERFRRFKISCSGLHRLSAELQRACRGFHRRFSGLYRLTGALQMVSGKFLARFKAFQGISEGFRVVLMNFAESMLS